ncbi:MAG TPA: hypothetical protein VIK53_09305 [Verrucomicrobiae bacterium]
MPKLFASKVLDEVLSILGQWIARQESHNLVADRAQDQKFHEEHHAFSSIHDPLASKDQKAYWLNSSIFRHWATKSHNKNLSE